MDYAIERKVVAVSHMEGLEACHPEIFLEI